MPSCGCPSTGTVPMRRRRSRCLCGGFAGWGVRDGAKQVWALDGGPGFAGDVFTDPAIRDVFVQAGYDLYIPSHRGTAYGTGLRCAEQQAAESDGGGRVTPDEFPACVAALRARWGAGLAHFDSWAAARDVRYLMEQAGVTSQRRAVLYGGSYGSYWGQRVLQTAPDLINGVWLDSIVDFESSFERADHNSHDAGMRLLTACEARRECSERLPVGVADLAARVVATYTSGRGCSQGGRDRARIQALFYRLLSSSPSEQALVAPLLVRADRCSAADEIAIDNAFFELDAPPSSPLPPLAYNPLLNRHIMLAELFRYGPRLRRRGARVGTPSVFGRRRCIHGRSCSGLRRGVAGLASTRNATFDGAPGAVARGDRSPRPPGVDDARGRAVVGGPGIAGRASARGA